MKMIGAMALVWVTAAGICGCYRPDWNCTCYMVDSNKTLHAATTTYHIGKVSASDARSSCMSHQHALLDSCILIGGK